MVNYANLERIKKEAMLHECIFVFHGITFRIYSQQESLWTYLNEWLWPYIIPVDESSIDYTFYAINGRIPFQIINEEKLSSHCGSEFYPIIINPVSQGQILTSRQQNEALVLNCSAECLFADTLAAIRQFTASRLQQRGAILLNAAAVFYDDMTYLFAGRSGSGKTTLALAGVDQGAIYIANDVVVLHSLAEGIFICGGMDNIGLFEAGLPIKKILSHKSFYHGDHKNIYTDFIDVDCIVFPRVHSESGISSTSYLSEEIGLNQFLAIYPGQQADISLTQIDPLLSFISLDFSYDRAGEAFQRLITFTKPTDHIMQVIGQ